MRRKEQAVTPRIWMNHWVEPYAQGGEPSHGQTDPLLNLRDASLDCADRERWLAGDQEDTYEGQDAADLHRSQAEEFSDQAKEMEHLSKQQVPHHLVGLQASMRRIRPDVDITWQPTVQSLRRQMDDPQEPLSWMMWARSNNQAVIFSEEHYSRAQQIGPDSHYQYTVGRIATKETTGPLPLEEGVKIYPTDKKLEAGRHTLDWVKDLPKPSSRATYRDPFYERSPSPAVSTEEVIETTTITDTTIETTLEVD